MNLHNFATANAPLRISSLPSLVTCPMRAVLLDAGLLDDESGAAAQTGSLLHAFVASWHAHGNDVEGALATTQREPFPLADTGKAEAWFRAYSADPRNRDCRIVAIEQSVTLALPCADHDDTGLPVAFRGTLDQIREEDGGFRVYDLKTGRASGLSMLDSYAFQLVAYSRAAAGFLGIDPARMLSPGVIRLQGYDVKGVDPALRPPGVFYVSPFAAARCEMLLDEIRNIVADIRSGRVDVRPGGHCSFMCPARGLQNCLPLSDQLAERVAAC